MKGIDRVMAILWVLVIAGLLTQVMQGSALFWRGLTIIAVMAMVGAVAISISNWRRLQRSELPHKQREYHTKFHRANFAAVAALIVAALPGQFWIDVGSSVLIVAVVLLIFAFLLKTLRPSSQKKSMY